MRNFIKNTRPKLLLFFRRFFFSFGLLAFFMYVLSFTDIPYYAYRNLSMESETLSSPPDIIVVLGGSGMPSPDGLIRCYYAAGAANKFKHANIIIALPYTVSDSLSQLKLMAHELVIRGVDSTRISFEPLGFNTHSQAENIAQIVGRDKSFKSLLVVSSPEHLYRAIKTFRKVGFNKVGAVPAFENPVDEVKIKDTKTSKDPRIKNLTLRYNMWSYLNYELLVMREYCAISYYKIKGWI